MEHFISLTSYQIKNLLRYKWTTGYFIFFFVLTEGLFFFQGESVKVTLSLFNLILLITPFSSFMLSMSYWYNERSFMEMMLAQPVNRPVIFFSVYCGLFVSLAVATAGGTLLPFVLHFHTSAFSFPAVITLQLLILELTGVFLSLGILIAIMYDDRAKGIIRLALISFFLFILYDVLIIFIVSAFGDYPIEKPVLILTMLNPVDLARIVVMLLFDQSALMGYTGALYRTFFGTSMGMITASLLLVLWIIIPGIIARTKFVKKDF